VTLNTINLNLKELLDNVINIGLLTDRCIYKQKIYQQGQKWNDGCNFICTCEDASRGLYRCNDRCPKYFNLPSQCHYEQDPKDSCCHVAKCDFNPTLTPPPTTIPIITPSTRPTQKPNSKV
jgi:hypothetical protein